MSTAANWRIPHQVNSPDDLRDALGRAIRTFPLRRSAWICWGTISTGVVSLSASALALVWFALHFYDRYYRFGPAIVEKEFPLPAVLIGLVALVGILATLKATTIWERQVILCENGLMVSDRRRKVYWLWQDITAFRASVARVYLIFFFTGTRHRYTLHHAEGREIVLDDSYQDIEQLAELIRCNLFPLLLDKALSDFHAGKRISFGPVSLIRGGGLEVNNRLFPFSLVQETRTKRHVAYLLVDEATH